MGERGSKMGAKWVNQKSIVDLSSKKAKQNRQKKKKILSRPNYDSRYNYAFA